MKHSIGRTHRVNWAIGERWLIISALRGRAPVDFRRNARHRVVLACFDVPANYAILITIAISLVWGGAGGGDETSYCHKLTVTL